MANKYDLERTVELSSKQNYDRFHTDENRSDRYLAGKYGLETYNKVENGASLQSVAAFAKRNPQFRESREFLREYDRLVNATRLETNRLRNEIEQSRSFTRNIERASNQGYNFDTAPEITGTIDEQDINKINKDSTFKVEIKNANSSLRIRNDAKKIISRLKKWEIVTYLGKHKIDAGHLFVKVSIGSGNTKKEGWVAAEYVKMDKPKVNVTQQPKVNVSGIANTQRSNNVVSVEPVRPDQTIENQEALAEKIKKLKAELTEEAQLIKDADKKKDILGKIKKCDTETCLNHLSAVIDQILSEQEKPTSTEPTPSYSIETNNGKWQSVGYSVDGANYIIWPDGEPKLITYNELTPKMKESLKQYEWLLRKVENLNLLLPALDQEDKNVITSKKLLNEKINNFNPLDLEKSTTGLNDLINNIFNNILKLEKEDVDLTDRISVLKYITDELGNYQLVRKNIAERNFNNLTKIPEEEFENFIDDPSNNNENIKKILGKDFKDFQTDINNKKAEALNYYIEYQENFKKQFPNLDQDGIKDLIVWSFVSSYAKIQLCETFIDKNQATYWDGYNGSNPEIELFSDIQWIWALDLSEKSLDWWAEAFKLVATEVAAIIAWAFTMWVWAYIINAAVYGTRFVKWINYLYKTSRVADLGFKWVKGVKNTSKLFSAKAQRFAAMSVLEWWAFYGWYWAMQSWIEGKNMYSMNDFYHSVAFIWAFKALNGAYKLAWLKFDPTKPLSQQKLVIWTQVSWDTLAFSAMWLWFEGILFEPGEWSAETLIQAFMMATAFRWVWMKIEQVRFRQRNNRVEVERFTESSEVVVQKRWKYDTEMLAETKKQSLINENPGRNYIIEQKGWKFIVVERRVFDDAIINRNKWLDDWPRIAEAENILGRTLNTQEKQAIFDAHLYSWDHIIRNKSILLSQHFTKAEREILIRSWICGRREQLNIRLNDINTRSSSIEADILARKNEITKIKGQIEKYKRWKTGTLKKLVQEYDDTLIVLNYAKSIGKDTTNLNNKIALLDKQIWKQVEKYIQGKENQILHLEEEITQLGLRKKILDIKKNKVVQESIDYEANIHRENKIPEINTNAIKSALGRDLKSLKKWETINFPGGVKVERLSNGEYKVWETTFKYVKDAVWKIEQDISSNYFKLIIEWWNKEFANIRRKLTNKEFWTKDNTFRLNKDGTLEKKWSDGGFTKVEINNLSAAEQRVVTETLLWKKWMGLVNNSVEKLSQSKQTLWEVFSKDFFQTVWSKSKWLAEWLYKQSIWDIMKELHKSATAKWAGKIAFFRTLMTWKHSTDIYGSKYLLPTAWMPSWKTAGTVAAFSGIEAWANDWEQPDMENLIWNYVEVIYLWWLWTTIAEFASVYTTWEDFVTFLWNQAQKMEPIRE